MCPTMTTQDECFTQLMTTGMHFLLGKFGGLELQTVPEYRKKFLINCKEELKLLHLGSKNDKEQFYRTVPLIIEFKLKNFVIQNKQLRRENLCSFVS